MRHRNRPRGQRPSQPSAPKTPPLDEQTGPIVLLGLIAAGLKESIAAYRAVVNRRFDERREFTRQHYPDDVTALDEKLWAWEPMTAAVELVELSPHTRLMAPRVVVHARILGAPSCTVDIFLCRRGLVVLETKNWPGGTRAPAILKDPDSLASASENASAIVSAIMSTLSRLNDPFPPAAST